MNSRRAILHVRNLPVIDPTDPRAFLGDIAPASSPRGYAQIGTERNGVFL
jgi:hypothetical protein